MAHFIVSITLPQDDADHGMLRLTMERTGFFTSDIFDQDGQWRVLPHGHLSGDRKN